MGLSCNDANYERRRSHVNRALAPRLELSLFPVLCILPAGSLLFPAEMHDAFTDDAEDERERRENEHEHIYFVVPAQPYDGGVGYRGEYPYERAEAADRARVVKLYEHNREQRDERDGRYAFYRIERRGGRTFVIAAHYVDHGDSHGKRYGISKRQPPDRRVSVRERSPRGEYRHSREQAAVCRKLNGRDSVYRVHHAAYENNARGDTRMLEVRARFIAREAEKLAPENDEIRPAANERGDRYYGHVDVERAHFGYSVRKCGDETYRPLDRKNDEIQQKQHAFEYVRH